MSIDGPSTDPRTAVVAAIRATTSGDLDSALLGIVSAAVSGLGADAGAILLADPDRTEPQVAASTGFREGEVEALARTTDIAGVTATPLVLDRGGVESSLGTLILRWPDGDPRTDHGDIVEALASLAALATERARETSNAAERSDWFERMSHTDPLTGIANERTVARVLELELARAGRQGGEVSLALFDIDDFRAANATDGGDLQVRTAKNGIRFGGDRVDWTWSINDYGMHARCSNRSTALMAIDWNRAMFVDDHGIQSGLSTAKLGIHAIPTAIIAVWRPAPRTAATVNASKMPGTAIKASMKRIRTVSTNPP